MARDTQRSSPLPSQPSHRHVEALEKIIHRDFFPDLPPPRAARAPRRPRRRPIPRAPTAPTSSPRLAAAAGSALHDPQDLQRQLVLGAAGRRGALEDDGGGCRRRGGADEDQPPAATARESIDKFLARHTERSTRRLPHAKDRVEHKRKYWWSAQREALGEGHLAQPRLEGWAAAQPNCASEGAELLDVLRRVLQEELHARPQQQPTARSVRPAAAQVLLQQAEPARPRARASPP